MSTPMEKVIELQARENLKKAMDKFGIEGTEQTIKSIYRGSPTVMEYMLKLFQKVLRGV